MKSPPVMTLALARSVGQDAGNKSMRKAGRAAWSADDFDAACEAMQRALRLIGVCP